MSLLEEPTTLARLANEKVWLMSKDNSRMIFTKIIKKFFDPSTLKKQWSWGDRLLNSMVVFPYCSFNSNCFDTKRWLSEYLTDFFSNNTLLVSNSISEYATLFEFQRGAFFSEIFLKSTLRFDRELFITDNGFSFLICFTELENLLFYGNIVKWIVQNIAETEDNNKELKILWTDPRKGN